MLVSCYGVFSYIPTSVFNNKFANFISIVKTLIMESNHDCITGLLLLRFCSIKCFSMHPGLFIEIYVMSAVMTFYSVIVQF